MTLSMFVLVEAEMCVTYVDYLVGQICNSGRAHASHICIHLRHDLHLDAAELSKIMPQCQILSWLRTRVSPSIWRH
jgi:hypothetical protein